jgi:hypothetical protein
MPPDCANFLYVYQGGPKRAAHAADQSVMAAAWKPTGGDHANARRLA